MKSCLSSIHLCAHFCSAVILCWFPYAMATPRCGGVLLKPYQISDEVLSAKIKNLAHLRMTLDLAAAEGRGPRTTVISGFKPQFYEKFKELVEHLPGKSEADLKEMIRQEIVHLQKKASHEQGREQEVRKNQLQPRHSFVRKYKVSKNLPVDRLSFNGFFEYIPSLHSVIVDAWGPKLGQSTLKILNLTTQEARSLVDNGKGPILSRDKKSILYINQANELARYDLIKNTEEVLDKMEGVEGTYFKLDLSPSENLLLITAQPRRGENKTVIYDFSTKKLEPFGEGLHIAKFIDESSVLSITIGNKISRLDLLTGEEKAIDDRWITGNFVISADRDFVISRYTKLNVLRSSDLKETDLGLPVDHEASLENIKVLGSLENQDALYIRHLGKTINEIYIFDPLNGFILASKFDEPSSGKRVMGLTASPSGNIVLTHYTDQNDKYFIDIWEGQ